MWMNLRSIPEPSGLNDVAIQRVNSFKLRRCRHSVADLSDSWNIYLILLCHPYSGIRHDEHTEIMVLYWFLYSSL